MSTLTHDQADWIALRVKTKAFIHSNADNTPRPGMCVKEKGHTPGSDKLCGVINKFEEKECVVVGHGWEPNNSKVFVWRGTGKEFFAAWGVD